MTNLDEIYGIDDRASGIAAYEDGILVCLAGPGTGKTFSFLERIKALYATQQVSANNIAYLTFIREIAKAFATDYEEEVGESDKPRMSTLHSFACRLIRNQGYQQGYDGPLYFMSVAERRNDRSDIFLGDLLPFVQRGELRTVPRLRTVFADTVKPAWRDNLDVETLDEQVATILPMYLRLSRAYRLIDWDQTIPFAHGLFSDLRTVPNWISQIRHLLVDEYQDFNRAEQAFLATLSSTTQSVIIVGDDDQSLYSSRGGSPDGLRSLHTSEETDQISLVRCYRCKPGILAAANTFLATMRPDPRPMIPKKKAEGGAVKCLWFKSKKAEVKYLTGFLNYQLGKLPPEEDLKPKHGITCLFPTKKALKSYMEPLMEAGIPCYSRQSTQNPDRKWLELALQLVSSPNQRFVERLLLENFSDIKPRHKKAMVKLVVDDDISPSNALIRLQETDKLSDDVATAALEFYELCQALSSQDPEQIAEKLIEYRLGEVPDLTNRIAFFIQQLDEADPEETIESLCDALMPETAAPPEDLRAVLFTTMHGSKGLTKKIVVMPGLEDAWLPGNAGGDELEEKKRLFYVALTRATDVVLITYPKNRPKGDPLNYGSDGRGEVSRFVADSGIPERYQKA